MGYRSIFPLLAHARINKSISFITKVYKENVDVVENSQVFSTFVTIYITAINILIIICATVYFSHVLLPLAVYPFTDTWQPIIPIYLTTSRSTVCVILNYCIQFIEFFFGSASYVFFDLLLAFLILHVILLTRILRKKINDIKLMALAKNPSYFDIKMNLRNVIMLHSELLA